MKHTKKDLQASIEKMQKVYDAAGTPDNVKEAIRPSLENAKKLLSEIEAEEKKKPAETEAIKKIVKTAEKKVNKAKDSGKSKDEKTPAVKKPAKKKPQVKLTKAQEKTLRQIVADAKKYAGYRGKSEAELRKDSQRKAKKPGSRTSKSGKTYREYRLNRADVAPEEKYQLESGGKIGGKAIVKYFVPEWAYGALLAGSFKVRDTGNQKKLNQFVEKVKLKYNTDYFMPMPEADSINYDVFRETNDIDNVPGNVWEIYIEPEINYNEKGGTIKGKGPLTVVCKTKDGKAEKHKVDSLKGASEVVLAYVKEKDLKPGTWAGANVFHKSKWVAWVGPSGKVWNVKPVLAPKKPAREITGEQLNKKWDNSFAKGGKLDPEDIKFGYKPEWKVKLEDGTYLKDDRGFDYYYSRGEAIKKAGSFSGKIEHNVPTHTVYEDADPEKRPFAYFGSLEDARKYVAQGNPDFLISIDVYDRTKYYEDGGKINDPELKTYAEGGNFTNSIDPSHQMTVFGYTTKNFTKEAKQSFIKAIASLEGEENKQGAYFLRVKNAVWQLAQTSDELLSEEIRDYPDQVHSLLQEVGALNFQTGKLVDTGFLNIAMAERFLQDGGEINEAYDDEGESGYAVVYTNEGQTFGIEVDIMDQAELVYDALVDYMNGHITEDELQNTLQSYMGDEGELLEPSAATIGKKYWSGFYQKEIPIVAEVNIDKKTHKTSGLFRRGGRLKSSLMRDRAYKSNEVHEIRYIRRTKPKNPRYTMEKGGELKKKHQGKKQNLKQ